MKNAVLKVLAEIDYSLYRLGIRKNKIKVYSIEETIDELINTQKSLIRFGDGEIEIIRGKSLKLQTVNSLLKEDLQRIIGYNNNNLMIALPDIFSDLSCYKKESRIFWKKHLLVDRKIYLQYCNTEKIYFNAFCSRVYYAFQEKDNCEKWISKLKEVWKNKEIVIVEGERTHNGVGNDLFEGAKTVERIIGPACNAYEKIEEIESCCKRFPKEKLFLVSLGVAAKVLAEKLYLDGYRVIDIGNIDLEYEWYLAKAKAKEQLYKHNIISVEENKNAGYLEYLEQIKQRIL